MKQIAVVSGKGGTGKTSFVAAFMQLAGSAVAADCDVDAANLHLILTSTAERATREVFRSGYEAAVAEERCRGCGICVDVCRFGALRVGQMGRVQVNDLLCEGCGACVDACPRQALTLVEKTAGELFVSETRYGPLVHGRLYIGQSSSGKLVSQVRSRARDVALGGGRELILIDGSPGVGCPVIASLTGVDAALLVAEPTVSGVHDLGRVLTLCGHFGIRPLVVVNKWDLNSQRTEEVEEAARQAGAELVGRVGFAETFAKAMAAGRTVVEYAPQSRAAAELKAVWQKIEEAIG